MDLSGSFNAALDDAALELYDELESCAYEKGGSILAEGANTSIAEQSMQEHGYNGSSIPVNIDEMPAVCEAHYYTDYILKQFEKDIEDKMATEFEEHRSRIFEIMSNYKESLSCALEDNVLADLSLAPMISGNHAMFAAPVLSPELNGDIQDASFSSESTFSDRYLRESQADIESCIDKQLLEIVCACFQICRHLNS